MHALLIGTTLKNITYLLSRKRSTDCRLLWHVRERRSGVVRVRSVVLSFLQCGFPI